MAIGLSGIQRLKILRKWSTAVMLRNCEPGDQRTGQENTDKPGETLFHASLLAIFTRLSLRGPHRPERYCTVELTASQ